ncbi:MAG: hypothetical protein WA581_02455 [Candidatus Acidiferrales bacterium]
MLESCIKFSPWWHQWLHASEDRLLFFYSTLIAVVLMLVGVILGYFLAKRHLEHYISKTATAMSRAYLDVGRQVAFHRAVGLMLPELPGFKLRSNATFSPQVAAAVGEFGAWSTALDAQHTDEKSMELVGREAWALAAKMTQKDLGFKEETPDPETYFRWELGMAVPDEALVKEVPDLTILNWETGLPVEHHVRMTKEPSSHGLLYVYKWNTTWVPCGVYVGLVNFVVGEQIETAMIVGERVRLFIEVKNGHSAKANEKLPWDSTGATRS